MLFSSSSSPDTILGLLAAHAHEQYSIWIVTPKRFYVYRICELWQTFSARARKQQEQQQQQRNATTLSAQSELFKMKTKTHNKSCVSFRWVVEKNSLKSMRSSIRNCQRRLPISLVHNCTAANGERWKFEKLYRMIARILPVMYSKTNFRTSFAGTVYRCVQPTRRIDDGSACVSLAVSRRHRPSSLAF